MKRVLAVIALLLMMLAAREARAEGAAELGGNQGLQSSTVLYVDILSTDDETIHWNGLGDIEVRNPFGALIGTISPGGSLGLVGQTPGPYRIKLLQNQTAATAWDVTVQNLGVPQAGRLYSIDWKLDGEGFGALNALTGSFYGLIDGGGLGHDAVVEFRLEGLAGGVYQINANGVGVNGPLSSRSVPLAGYTFTPVYPIYLNPPVVANYNPLPADISPVTFTGGITGCTQIGPGATLGRFEFTTSVAATGFFTCDLNGDMVFDPVSDEDFMLQISTEVGTNTFFWPGYDRFGLPIPAGTYECRISVNVGEFHYAANDIETSYAGMRFFEVDDMGTRTPLDMYWNDTLVQINAKTMPNGQVGLGNSGPNGLNAGDPLDPADPNVNARSWGDFSNSGKGDNAYLDTFAVLSTAPGNPVQVEIVDGSADSDGDQIVDAVEICNIGTDPFSADSDGDGILDTVETRIMLFAPPRFFVDSPVDFDLDGTIDALDLDSDNDDIPDSVDGSIDIDMDDRANFRDTDDDGDLIASKTELMLGTEPFSTDSDDDGIGDFSETNGGMPVDTDTDGTIDALDLDSDADGILDETEGEGDIDGDSVGNYRDLDSDGDTLLDAVEGTSDFDADSAPDYKDNDDDQDGAPTKDEVLIGTNHLDFDTDDDGIDDGIETDNGDPIDTDNDGTIDALDLDSDSDTISDEDERVAGPDLRADVDGDLILNFRDKDDDNDLISTALEVLLTSDPYRWDSDDDGIFDFIELSGGIAVNTDGDAYLDVWDVDSDNDTLPDAQESILDEDLDGIANFRDMDDDGDTIPTLVEIMDSADPLVNSADVDLDTIVNWYDKNSDGDGFTDKQENRVDLDNDGIPDYLDPDSGADVENDLDSDGVHNLLEQFLGTDPLDPDTDNDTLGDWIETNGGFPVNTDGDATIDALDLDSDADGLSDMDEALADTDTDGTPDFRDTDDDGDDVPTTVELADAVTYGDDIDGNMIPNWYDPDADGDMIPDGEDGTNDVDGDTIPNYLDPDSGGDPDGDYDGDNLSNGLEWALGTNPFDPDSDGDLLPDIVETNIGSPIDTDVDGTIDALDSDSDNDGLSDAEEFFFDRDEDGRPDFRDFDDDDDGVLTATEVMDALTYGDDVDNDTLLNWHDPDADDDGFIDGDDGTIDSDTDGIPNYLDADSGGGGGPVGDLDSDGVPDAVEDAIGTNKFNGDTDGDGIGDFIETDGGTPVNTDGDAEIDALDLDTDADTVSDMVEGAGDADGDGIPNFRDPDSNGNGIPDADEYPGDKDGDGIPDFLDTRSGTVQLAGKTFACALAPAPGGAPVWDAVGLYLLALAGLWARLRRRPTPTPPRPRVRGRIRS